MLENLFKGLFDTDLTTVISVTDFLLCLGASLVIGILMAFAYMYRTRYISGKSPGEGNGYSLQYSCLGNSMDRGATLDTIHEVAKSWTGFSN